MSQLELIYLSKMRKISKLLWKTVWQFFIMLKFLLPSGPAISLLDSYLREMKIYVLKIICINNIIAAVSS